MPDGKGHAVASVRSVRALIERDGQAVEVISSRPVVPTINKLDDPPRLVIDLPNATLPGGKQRIDVRSGQINSVRVSQFQNAPPITRIVVDLAEPVAWTWDVAGNRLMVRLHASQEAKQSSVPSFTKGIEPAAVPLSKASSGAVVLAGSRVPAGSSVTAGSDTAILRLARGGEVRICPGTTVSVTSSQNGSSVMLGMSTGTLEAHYSLESSTDSVVTPDFRIVLAGPGEFHYGISSDSRGNTCVQALPGNAAPVTVSELLGNASYQVRPDEQVVFRAGRLSTVETAVTRGCTCPAPMPPVLRASDAPAATILEAKVPSSGVIGHASGKTAAVRANSAASPATALAPHGPETAALPAAKSNEIHVEVDAPFVFRASDPVPPPAPTREAERLPFRSSPRPALLQIAALPPPQARMHHGVLGRIRSFLAAIFG